MNRESPSARAAGGLSLVHRRAPRVAAALREPVLVPGSELVKGRGGPRCTTRPLDAADDGGSA